MKSPDITSLDERVEQLLRENKTFEKARQRLDVIQKIKAELILDISRREEMMAQVMREIFPNSKSPLGLVQLLFNQNDDSILEVQKEEYVKLLMRFNESANMLELLAVRRRHFISKATASFPGGKRAKGATSSSSGCLQHCNSSGTSSPGGAN